MPNHARISDKAARDIFAQLDRYEREMTVKLDVSGKGKDGGNVEGEVDRLDADMSGTLSHTEDIAGRVLTDRFIQATTSKKSGSS
ncbi:MAG TPA: hypothetical protein VFX30_04490 [bacterium]|nr:hypothetical protein [bacterium]